jgi:hypothetical protein
MSGARVKITCNLRGNVVAGGGGGGGTSWAKDRKPSTGFRNASENRAWSQGMVDGRLCVEARQG